jgi:hypothetical protein
MKYSWFHIFILISMLLMSCDSYAPYPVLADEDALLKLECKVGETERTEVNVSKVFMITHEHRLPGEQNKELNSSLRFTVNGADLEYTVEKGISDKYIIHHKFSAGDRIEVSCSAPGLPDVSAATVIPEIPRDLIKDFDLRVEDRDLRGRLTMNYDSGNHRYLSAELHYNDTTFIYRDGVFIGPESDGHKEQLSYEGGGIWGIDSTLPGNYEYIDPDGRFITSRKKVEATLKVNILSKELFYARLHTQSSSMSPSSYTNVIGGLGYVGGIVQYSGETFTFEY